MPSKAIIQHRRDTASQWDSVNPTLAQGEIGYVTSGTNAGNFKVGDGSSVWAALPFVRTPSETITASTGLTKTGSDIRAVFGVTDTTVLRGDHAGATTGVHGIVSPAVIVGTSTAQELSNKTFANFIEKVNVVLGAPISTNPIYTSTAAIWYYTSDATTNYTLNFRSSEEATLNSVLSIGQSLTATVMHTNGTTAYYPTAFQVDGTAVTPKWQVSALPEAGDINSINSYSFTILKTADATFTVFASQSRFD
jgi:hypothetical protein